MRERVRRNIGNNMFTAVEIKSSISAHILHTLTSTHAHTPAALSQRVALCNLAHPFHRLGLSSVLSRQSQTPSGYSNQSLNDVTFENTLTERQTNLDCGKVSGS